MTERKTRSRLTGGIIAVIVLAVCLVGLAGLWCITLLFRSGEERDHAARAV